MERTRPCMSLPRHHAKLVPSALELQHVSRVYGSFIAVRDVSLSLPAGSSVVLLGSNGAGKSTLLKLFAGLTAPTHGTVQIFGASPLSQRSRIAYMAHQTMLYDELTAAENLLYLLGLQRPGLSSTERKEHVRDALSAVDLDPANPRRLAEYSQGMRQRTSLARVLLADPDLLLLDEPFSNLDVASAQTMVARLQVWLTAAGTASVSRTLVLTTHQAQLAQPLAHITLTMEAGRLLERSSASDSPIYRETRQGAIL